MSIHTAHLCFMFGTVPHFLLADRPWVSAGWEDRFSSSTQQSSSLTGTPSAQQRSGWMNTSSTTMRLGHLPLGSRLAGKLHLNLSRRALVSPLLARNRVWIFSGTECGKQRCSEWPACQGGCSLSVWLTRFASNSLYFPPSNPT